MQHVEDGLDQQEFERLSERELIDLIYSLVPFAANIHYQEPLISTLLFRELYLDDSKDNNKDAKFLYNLFSSEKKKFSQELMNFLLNKAKTKKPIILGEYKVYFYEKDESYKLSIYPKKSSYSNAMLALIVEKDGTISACERELGSSFLRERYKYDETGKVINISFWSRYKTRDFNQINDRVSFKGNNSLSITRAVGENDYLLCPTMLINDESVQVGDHPIRPSEEGVIDIKTERIKPEAKAIDLKENELREFLLNECFSKESLEKGSTGNHVDGLINSIRLLSPTTLTINLKDNSITISYKEGSFSIAPVNQSEKMIEKIRSYKKEALKVKIELSIIPKQIEGNRYLFNIFDQIDKIRKKKMTDYEKKILLQQIKQFISTNNHSYYSFNTGKIETTMGFDLSFCLPDQFESSMCKVEIDEDGNITDQTPYLRDRDHKWETVKISITQPESEVDPRNLEMIKLMSDLVKLTNQKFVDLLMNDDYTFSQSSYGGLEKLLQHSGLSEKYSSFHFPDNIKALCDKISSLEWKIKHGPTYEEELLDKKAEEIARKLFDSGQLRGVFQRSDSAAHGRNTDYFISEIIVDGVTYEVSTATNTTTTPTQHNVKSFFKGVTRKFVSKN